MAKATSIQVRIFSLSFILFFSLLVGQIDVESGESSVRVFFFVIELSRDPTDRVASVGRVRNDSRESPSWDLRG